jgi:hypothetical protein
MIILSQIQEPQANFYCIYDWRNKVKDEVRLESARYANSAKLKPTDKAKSKDSQSII